MNAPEQETIMFRGQRWLVAVAQWDEAPVGSHWHLTLTGPVPPRQRTPLRQRFGRTRGRKGDPMWRQV